MIRTSVLLTCIFGALAVSGCNRGNTLPDFETGAASSGGANGASTNPFGENGGIGVFDDGRGPQGNLLDELVIYFEYDRSDVPSQYNETLAAHGRYLSSNPNAQVRLEGHADERRAQAVRRVLLLQGASAEQLSTVSYGEERPAALGSNEEAYSLNRRVEIVYRQ